jgi:hypothetical protein
MKKASSLVIGVIILCAGCESDGNAHRSTAAPAPLAKRAVSDGTPAKQPAGAGKPEEGVAPSPLERTLDLQSGVYGLPFGATIEEVMKWCADNSMAVANPTEKDIRNAARNAVEKMGNLIEAVDSFTPLERELLKLTHGLADVDSRFELGSAAAKEELDLLKNPGATYEGQKYYLLQVHKGISVYLDGERKVCTDDRIRKTAYLLALTPTEKSERMRANGPRMLLVLLFGDIGQEPKTYATFALFGETPERSTYVQVELVRTQFASESPGQGTTTAWAENLLLGVHQGSGLFWLLHYDSKAAASILELHSKALADFEKNYREKKREALAQVQHDF